MIRKKRVPLLQMLTVGLLPSFLKVWYYRLRGARIEKGVKVGFLTVLQVRKLEIREGTDIGFGTIIRGREVYIGRHVKIGSMTFLDVERISIGDDTKINEQVFAGGPMLPESQLRIGRNCIVMQYTFLNATKPITIGDGTGIGGHCLLFTHGSWQSELEGYPVTFAPITIGNNVWLPWRIFVLPGVTIGDNVTIGANSLVTRSIAGNSLAAGMPAQILRSGGEYPRQISDEERRSRLERILDDFFRYLEYHGYSAAIRERGAMKEAWLGSEQQRLIWADSLSFADVEADGTTTVLTLEGSCTPPNGSAAMWLDVKSATRRGSNLLGEELVQFLSRFGIRFYRLD